ncbi:hypothetical protein L2E82_32324 [Cichorium intybus]|uniref:Uncharacterized protein n=1 Tax=Cichorium intybus TaxID=13427 RepID=A0ACB9BJ10_CICIN|nr:hypothetical protein L2E82_32324 [Cichorium intybus]
MGLSPEGRMDSKMAETEGILLVQEDEDGLVVKIGGKTMGRGSLMPSDHDEDDEEVEQKNNIASLLLVSSIFGLIRHPLFVLDLWVQNLRR